MAIEVGALVSERYLLQESFAEGQICTIFRAFDRVLHRRVAIKVAPALYRETYEQAVKKTSTLSHNNIISLFDTAEYEGDYCIIQELVDGQSLDYILEEGLSPLQAIEVGQQICKALQYTHSYGIIHGDLTPSAILRDTDGVIRINNFCCPPNEEYFAPLHAWLSNEGQTDAMPILSEDTESQDAQVAKVEDIRAIAWLLLQLTVERNSGGQIEYFDQMNSLKFATGTPESLQDLIKSTLIAPDYGNISAESFFHALDECRLEIARESISSAVMNASKASRRRRAIYRHTGGTNPHLFPVRQIRGRVKVFNSSQISTEPQNDPDFDFMGTPGIALGALFALGAGAFLFCFVLAFLGLISI